MCSRALVSPSVLTCVQLQYACMVNLASDCLANLAGEASGRSQFERKVAHLGSMRGDERHEMMSLLLN